MRGFIQIFKMDMGNMIKNPVLIWYNTIFSILITFVMGFLTSGAYANASDAYNYYAVSFLIFAMMNGALTATNCFMERDIKKPNLRIIYSPVGSFPIYFSKISASCIFDYVCHLLVLAILIPALHLNFGGRSVGFIILLMIPIEFASCALGTLFCCIFKTEEAASTLLSTTISILAFLGGTFFSLDGMGRALAFASRISPFKWLTDVFFAIIFDSNLTLFLPVFLGSVVVSILLVFGCSKFFRTEDYLC
jgi:ABC-2 type transport system permease protein